MFILVFPALGMKRVSPLASHQRHPSLVCFHFLLGAGCANADSSLGARARSRVSTQSLTEKACSDTPDRSSSAALRGTGSLIGRFISAVLPASRKFVWDWLVSALRILIFLYLHGAVRAVAAAPVKYWFFALSAGIKTPESVVNCGELCRRRTGDKRDTDLKEFVCRRLGAGYH